jgi:uncharacterized repeat protein (TIGR01451 family)
VGTLIGEDQRGVARRQGSLSDIVSFEAPIGDADLSLIAAVSPVFAREGDLVVFSVQVVNRGPLDATGITVRDDLDLGLTLVSSDVSQGGYDEQTGLWRVGGLKAGATAVLTMTTRVEPGTAGTSVTNSATIVAADQTDPVPENNTSTVALTVVELLDVYLPMVLKEHVAFPIHVGNAIPTRAIRYQGEVFYTTEVRLPDEMPAGGAFYFSSQSMAVTDALVDDVLIVRLDGREVFSFDFSIGGYPAPAHVPIPRATMAQLAGRTAEVVYQDRYATAISASDVWLIWVP